VDEDIQRPETAYSLSKAMGEEMAKQFCRWDARTKIVGLRFSNVMEPHDYENFPGFNKSARLRHWNLWTYIDARDGAQAIRLALQAKLIGAHVFGIANADSVMTRGNEALLDEVFPGTRRKRPIKPNESLISIEKAERVLGYKPQFAWRKQVAKAKTARKRKA
jgi:nucleoside-diphosphate-sugar epimerase